MSEYKLSVSQSGRSSDILVAPVSTPPRIRSVDVQESFRIRVTFVNDEERLFDVTPLLKSGGFARLADPVAFADVRVDDVGGGIEWATGPNLSSDTLYHVGVEA
jgi:hypothetical protein